MEPRAKEMRCESVTLFLLTFLPLRCSVSSFRRDTVWMEKPSQQLLFKWWKQPLEVYPKENEYMCSVCNRQSIWCSVWWDCLRVNRVNTAGCYKVFQNSTLASLKEQRCKWSHLSRWGNESVNRSTNQSRIQTPVDVFQRTQQSICFTCFGATWSTRWS